MSLLGCPRDTKRNEIISNAIGTRNVCSPAKAKQKSPGTGKKNNTPNSANNILGVVPHSVFSPVAYQPPEIIVFDLGDCLLIVPFCSMFCSMSGTGAPHWGQFLSGGNICGNTKELQY